MNVLLVGSGAREHALARAIKKSAENINLFCFAGNNNPGIKELSAGFKLGKITDLEEIVTFALENKVELAFIGPEAPLALGLADKLWENNISCIGPKQKLAQLETSKSFTRDLLTEYYIDYSPRYKKFTTTDGIKEFLNELGNLYVIKADGLMSGKGVKVAGDHLHSHEEALLYCQELISAGNGLVIEEKLIGLEFSLMSFSDGVNLAHMPPVQDHKRAFDGDLGPNTGSMGSYSDADHLLPFLTKENILRAQRINQAVANALKHKFKEDYKGILYGGFMITKDGVKLIEYNARLGDPEALNVLALLQSDFIVLCQAIVNGNLTQSHAQFLPQATVCKYAVPEGYPDNPQKNQKIDTSNVENKDLLHFAGIDEKEDGLFTTGSRTIAIIAMANTIYEAEKIAEEEINRIKGQLFHRKDIGTKELIEKNKIIKIL